MGRLITISNLSVKYGADYALSNVNTFVNDGDFTGVIGPNGGGKTTFVKAILGLIPYEGEITFFEGLDKDKSKIGYLPQLNNFDRSFPISVAEIIVSGVQKGSNLLKAGRSYSSSMEKARELMHLAGIEGLGGKSIDQISGGELQRALLCRALISEPRLLILDEPATFVDSKFEQDLYEILQKLNDRMAIIMVSHDVGTITSYVKSIMCINRTVHRHDTGELTPEMLRNYNCPIQVLTHGDIPHTVLEKH